MKRLVKSILSIFCVALLLCTGCTQKPEKAELDPPTPFAFPAVLSQLQTRMLQEVYHSVETEPAQIGADVVGQFLMSYSYDEMPIQWRAEITVEACDFVCSKDDLFGVKVTCAATEPPHGNAEAFDPEFYTYFLLRCIWNQIYRIEAVGDISIFHGMELNQKGTDYQLPTFADFDLEAVQESVSTFHSDETDPEQIAREGIDLFFEPFLQEDVPLHYQINQFRLFGCDLWAQNPDGSFLVMAESDYTVPVPYIATHWLSANGLIYELTDGGMAVSHQCLFYRFTPLGDGVWQTEMCGANPGMKAGDIYPDGTPWPYSE